MQIKSPQYQHFKSDCTQNLHNKYVCLLFVYLLFYFLSFCAAAAAGGGGDVGVRES